MDLMRTRIRRPAARRGMAMVEMVFVLPVLILLVFAIAKFGLMFNRWLTLSSAVREGARAGSLYRTNCKASDVDQAVHDAIQRYAVAGGIDYSTLVIPDLVNQCISGLPLAVTASYSFDLSIPYAPESLKSITLSYTSSMRNE